jgi:tetratricopeptide (TPR) repeat protein
MIGEQKGNLGEAQRNYLAAASLDDSSAHAHCCLALLYERMDLFDEVIATYHPALNRHPHYLKAFCNVAGLFHTQGEYDQAVRYVERVLELDPKHAQAPNNLGLIYGDMGKWTDAGMAFEQRVELDMFRPEARFNLARILYCQHGGDLGPDLVHLLIARL